MVVLPRESPRELHLLLSLVCFLIIFVASFFDGTRRERVVQIKNQLNSTKYNRIAEITSCFLVVKSRASVFFEGRTLFYTFTNECPLDD